MKRNEGRELYQAALAATRDASIDANDALRWLGILVDFSEDFKEEEGIKSALQWCDRLQRDDWNAGQKALLHYYHSNAWGVFRILTRSDDCLLNWEQSELDQMVLHLRVADRLADEANLETRLKCKILTNLGNALSQNGRVVDALKCWDEVIAWDHEFGMAHGNRGYELARYAACVHDAGHKALLLAEAHKGLKRALDLPLEGRGQQVFGQMLNRIEADVPRGWLEKSAASMRCQLGRSPAERAYREWCLKKGLFLNDLNDIGPHPVAAADVLMLPGITVPLGEPPRLQGFFNQMKQEFASARYFYYEGTTSRRPHFSDRWVKLANTLDYPVLSLAAEKVRMAFRSAYSLLDKVAFFLNSYLGIGLPERSVSFKSLWYEGSGTEKQLRRDLNRNQNFLLRALFSLSKDLYERKPGFEEATEPEARIIADLRNHLEHKYLKLRSMGGGARSGTDSLVPRDAESLECVLARADFEMKALWVLRTARAALIYLSLAVHIEERERARKKPRKERVALMWLEHLDDRWKI